MRKYITGSLHFKLLLLFPLFTLFQSFFFLDWINKALLMLVIAVQLALQFRNFRIKKKWAVVLGLLIIVHIWALFNTKFPLYNSNMLFYFVFWVLYALYFVDFYEILDGIMYHNLLFIKKIVQIWCLIVAISVFLPISYVRNAAWGNEIYFVSIAGDTFRLAPTSLMIASLILVLYCYTKKRTLLLYLIIPVYSFLMCGSRTYLGVGFLVVLAFWYLFCENKRYFYLTLIPIVLIFFYLILYSAAGSKITATTYSTSSFYDKWGTITNGRTIFWKLDIEYFLKENFLKNLFGCGFNFDYEITRRYYTSAHWAHNDFISVLLNFGYIGLGIYIYTIWILLRKYLKNIEIPKVILALVILIWFLNAMFNMFYTYTCSMICYPIMLVALRNYYKGRVVTNNEYK